MKRIYILLFFGLLSTSSIHALTDLLGNWELYKVVKVTKVSSDTQNVSNTDALYVKYYFSYNNTFSSFHQKEKEDATGKWGFDKKENSIKIRNHTFAKSKTGLGDYNIKLTQLGKTIFVQVIADKKGKPLEDYIYRKIQG